MSRAIKFRGKRVDNGEWVYGYFASHPEREALILIVDESEGYSIYYDVIPETVGQFTGLYDRNLVEIYEGAQLSGGLGYFITYGHPRVCIGEYIDDDLTYYDEDSELVPLYGVYMDTKRGPAGLSQTTAGRFEVL